MSRYCPLVTLYQDCTIYPDWSMNMAMVAPPSDSDVRWLEFAQAIGKMNITIKINSLFKHWAQCLNNWYVTYWFFIIFFLIIPWGLAM